MQGRNTEMIAGFIVADDKGVIHGSGTTGLEALKEAANNTGLSLWPATRDLLTKLGPWKVVEGVATREEDR